MQARRRFVTLLIIGMLIAFAGWPAAAEGGFFGAETEAIHYIGRVQRGERVLWSWPGTGLRVRYQNSPTVRLRFSAEHFPEFSSNNVPRIVEYRVDDGPWQALVISPGANLDFLLNTLPDSGQYTLEVVKTSEGRLTFGGITLEPGGRLARPPIPPRRIEVVGDSISAGFRVNGERSYASPGDHNARLGYGWLLGEMLDAEVHLIAITGHGLVHNYDTPPELSITVPTYYHYLHREPTTQHDWRWQPDLIIVNLGTNDTTPPVTPPEVFREHYAHFLRTLRERNPKALILALQPFGLFNGTFPVYPDEIRAAVQARRAAGDERVFFAETAGWLSERDFTDGVHPNAQGQRRAAERLLPFIRELTGWP